MKLKKAILIILVFVLVGSMTGCSFNFFSIESLLSPPALSGKNGEVQTAFNKLMSGKTIQLKTPAKGDYQSSFVLFDVDGDSEEEALAFYVDTSSDATVRLALLECVNDTWVISTDIKGAGSGVYDVSFCDFDKDGKAEIVIGWSLFDNKTTRVASVYETNTGETGVLELKTLANEYYNSRAFADFNSDGKKDLVLVYLDDSGDVQKSYLRTFTLGNDGNLNKYSELLLESSITSVSSIQSDSVNSGTVISARLFIDCYKTDTSMLTEVVYWNPRKSTAVRVYKNPLESTLRSSKVLCRDIDSDGCLEVPVTTKLSGDDTSLNISVASQAYTFTLLKWLNSYGDKSDGTIVTLFNPIDSYLLRFTWGDEVTVRYDQYRKALSFCLWDEDKKAIKDELFAIAYYSADEKKEDIPDDYKILYEAEGDGTFYYSMTAYGNEYGITGEHLVSSFIKI